MTRLSLPLLALDQRTLLLTDTNARLLEALAGLGLTSVLDADVQTLDVTVFADLVPADEWRVDPITHRRAALALANHNEDYGEELRDLVVGARCVQGRYADPDHAAQELVAMLLAC